MAISNIRPASFSVASRGVSPTDLDAAIDAEEAARIAADEALDDRIDALGEAPPFAPGWNFDALNADADPGNGDIRFNSSTLASITQLYIDDLDRLGGAMAAYIATWDNGGSAAVRGSVYISKASAPSSFVLATVTGSITSATGYSKVPVTVISSAGSFAAGDDVSVQFTPAGAPGADGISAEFPEQPALSEEDPLTAANSTTALEGSAITTRVDVVEEVIESLPLKANSTGGSFTPAQSFLIISWGGTGGGPISEDGFLREVEVAAGGATIAGAKLQLYVFRPSAALPAGGVTASITFAHVATLGEIPLTDIFASNYPYTKKITGLMVPVLAGDVIGIRNINASNMVGTNTGGTHEYDACNHITKASVGTSLGEFDAGFTATSSGATPRRLLYTAKVVSGPFLTVGSGPNSLVGLTEEGNLPPAVGRAADMPWKGRTVIFVGDSIATASGGGDSAATGWVPQVIDMLQCNGINEASGSAMITYVGPGHGGGGDNLSLSGTIAQFTADFGAGFAVNSYENKIIGRSAEMVVLCHGINDSNRGSGLAPVGLITDTTNATFLGANNVVIQAILADTPNCRIVIATIPHEYTNYTTPPATILANRASYRQAQLDLAAKYNFPVIDFMKLAGVNKYTIESGDALFDVIHPTQAVKDVMARVAYAVLRNA